MTQKVCHFKLSCHHYKVIYYVFLHVVLKNVNLDLQALNNHYISFLISSPWVFSLIPHKCLIGRGCLTFLCAVLHSFSSSPTNSCTGSTLPSVPAQNWLWMNLRMCRSQTPEDGCLSWLPAFLAFPSSLSEFSLTKEYRALRGGFQAQCFKRCGLLFLPPGSGLPG